MFEKIMILIIGTVVFFVSMAPGGYFLHKTNKTVANELPAPERVSRILEIDLSQYPARIYPKGQIVPGTFKIHFPFHEIKQNKESIIALSLIKGSKDYLKVVLDLWTPDITPYVFQNSKYTHPVKVLNKGKWGIEGYTLKDKILTVETWTERIQKDHRKGERSYYGSMTVIMFTLGVLVYLIYLSKINSRLYIIHLVNLMSKKKHSAS